MVVPVTVHAATAIAEALGTATDNAESTVNADARNTSAVENVTNRKMDIDGGVKKMKAVLPARPPQEDSKFSIQLPAKL